jgi:hypothetical protein
VATTLRGVAHEGELQPYAVDDDLDALAEPLDPRDRTFPSIFAKRPCH